jgi:hypothetical protein
MGLPRPLTSSLTIALCCGVLLGVAVLSCSDGKLNLLLFVYGDDEEKEPEETIEGPVIESSSSKEPLSSSSSSSEEPLPISSSSIPALSSSSSIPNSPPKSSSSNKSVRSSTSVKVNKNGEEYVDYPTLEEGAPSVKVGWASRYWDGCKPHCSWPDNVETSQPWDICRNCDRNNKEMPAYFLNSNPNWAGEYLGTSNACDNNVPHMEKWKNSPAYAEWKTANPDYPGSAAYTCWDMTPHVINDTLAYAFAATPKDGVNRCGKCYMLQFDGDDRKNPGRGRDTHKALKGKTLIVMSNNTGGLEPNQFDIMIPGGGLGDFDAFTDQIGVPKADLGETFGGLLSTCIFDVDYYKTPMEVLIDCVRQKCNSIFGGNKPKELLNGCLFMTDWYMAADNPTLIYKEVQCPQYLTDKYKSGIHKEKPPPLW